MTFPKLLKSLLLLFPLTFLGIHESHAGVERGSRVYVLSIGINEYQGMEMRNAVSDARRFVQKVQSDNPRRSFQEVTDHNHSIKKHPSLESENWYYVDTVISHILLGSRATRSNIRERINAIAREIDPDDYFLFYFGGLAWKDSSERSVLLTYQERKIDFQNILENEYIYVSELGKQLEKISAKKQLFVSEACYGESFAHDLIANLFQSDPRLAAGSERKRIILTTRGMGYDGFKCGDTAIAQGPLMNFILKSGNVLQAIDQTGRYELELTETELSCDFQEERYFKLYSETEYRSILLKTYDRIQQQLNPSRGAGEVPTKTNKVKQENQGARKIALLIGTNSYPASEGWGDLRNPIRDARSIGSILEMNYGMELIELYDKPRDTILTRLIQVKNSLNPQDQLLVFVAGHGYYSSGYSDGNIVFSDSKDIKQDYLLKSYLQMSTLEQLLDNSPSRQVFLILDICFGATFDLDAQDLPITPYKQEFTDLSPKEIFKRKAAYTSRIFLASGRYEVPDYWSEDQDHSPFANKLLESLNKSKGFCTPSNLYQDVQANITEPFLKRFGSHEERGDFIMLKK